VITETIAGLTGRRIAGTGITLSVQKARQGAPLILLHGHPQNGMCRCRIAAAFVARSRVNSPDPRACGQSDARRTMLPIPAVPSAAWRRMSWPG
jgi:haloacetate dehalogenase